MVHLRGTRFAVSSPHSSISRVPSSHSQARVGSVSTVREESSTEQMRAKTADAPDQRRATNWLDNEDTSDEWPLSETTMPAGKARKPDPSPGSLHSPPPPPSVLSRQSSRGKLSMSASFSLFPRASSRCESRPTTPVSDRPSRSPGGSRIEDWAGNRGTERAGTSRWKMLPARPGDGSVSAVSQLDSVHEHDYSPAPRRAEKPGRPAQQPGAPGQTLAHSPTGMTRPNPPPSAKFPVNVYGKIRVERDKLFLEIPRPDSTTMGESAPADVASPSTSQPPWTNRHTTEERLWLHRHYRGELPFLRAWCLDMASEDERAVGLEILRDLMEADRVRKARRAEQDQKRARLRGSEKADVMEVPIYKSET